MRQLLVATGEQPLHGVSDPQVEQKSNSTLGEWTQAHESLHILIVLNETNVCTLYCYSECRIARDKREE